MKKYVVQQDGKGDYTTIQAAVDAWEAAGGAAMIFVRPGQYTEQIEISDTNEDLVLDGGES